MMRYLAPDADDLADFVKNAPMQDIVNELFMALARIENPAITERAKRTMWFNDEIPTLLQATYERGYLAGYLVAVKRNEADAIQ